MSRLEPYIYTPLPPGHIRLLHVPPQFSPTGTLSCKLKIFSLHERPQYEALSYAWGTEQALEHIVCNGAKLPVTPHLLEGLRSISEAIFVQWLWIDAICINQSDGVEKANQVMQMWQIYSAASCVVVWMGPSDITANLISTIRAVSEDFDKVADELSRDETRRILSPLEACNDLAKLFTPSWFERLWVMQEVLLAHSAIALYGTQVIELWSVLELGNAISITGFHVRDLPNSLHLMACASFSSWKQCTKHKLGAAGVAELLSSVRIKQTSERLDRVYAILGCFDERVREKVIIDYSQTSREEYWKAYTCFCRLILQEYGESYLPYLSCADRRTMMPSWCLNLDVRESSEDLYNKRRGAGIDAINTRSRGITFSGSGLAIFLEAFQVDVLTEIALPSPTRGLVALLDDREIGEQISFLFVCNDLFKSIEMANSEEKKPLESLASVLVGGTYTDEAIIRPYGALEAEEDLYNCLQMWKDAQLGSIPESHLVNHGRNLSYIRSTVEACCGRSLSLTVEGQWVLVPQDAQKDDIIVVIKGFRFPYVLRPAIGENGQDSDTYNILGPCYLDDVMDGEILRSEAFKAAGWTDIKII
jgi:hypothetical protein